MVVKQGEKRRIDAVKDEGQTSNPDSICHPAADNVTGQLCLIEIPFICN